VAGSCGSGRGWADHQDSDVTNVLVYCDEDVKVLFSQGQQLLILLAAESCVSNGLTFLTAVGNQEFDLPGDTLIEERWKRDCSSFSFRVVGRGMSPSAPVWTGSRYVWQTPSVGRV
jgi:hypothetical protein